MSTPSFIDRLSDAHRATATSLPGASLPEVTARRQSALDSFLRHGLPTARLETWKFTSLTGLERQVPPQPANEGSIDAARLDAVAIKADAFRLVFVNGRFDAVASKLAGLPKGVRLLPLSQSEAELPAALASAGDDRAASLAELNAAFASDGLLLQIDDGVLLDRPVELLAFGAPALVNLRHLVRLGRKAEATLIENYQAAGSTETGWNNIVAGIELAEGAKLTHIRLQGESAATYHAALGRVSVGTEARYAHVSVQAGGKIARHELQVAFVGSDAEVDMQGLVLARGAAHIDHTLHLHHALPDCRSNQLFKHVVDDQGHAVFQGGIRVAPHAQKTDAQQLSRTLLLADRAQIDTKPELEILADDVKCSHGASIGDVDPQQLFYMQARGIPVAEARRLLLSGFAYEIVSAVPEGVLRDHVEAFVEAWLVQEKDGPT